MKSCCWNLLLCVVLTFGMAPSQGALAAWKDVLEATVHMTRGDHVGTGCCVLADDQHLYVLTNRHVAGAAGNSVRCRFYHRGHDSQPIPGRVVWSRHRPGRYVDVALVAVRRDRLGRVSPPVIPLGESSPRQPGTPVVTVGCPGGRWPRLVQGRVYTTDDGAGTGDGWVFAIKPPVYRGQSGSAVFDEAGTRVVGLLAWNDEDARSGRPPSLGIAQNVAVIRAALHSAATSCAEKSVSLTPVAEKRADDGPRQRHIVIAPTRSIAEQVRKAARGANLPPSIIHCHEGTERVVHWPADDPRRKYDLLWVRAPQPRMVELFQAQCGPDGCFRFPWRQAQPQPAPPSPAPPSNPFPTLPPERGSSDPQLAARVDHLERSQTELAAALSEVQQLYADVKAHWSEVREFVDNSGNQKLQHLARRIEEFDREFGNRVGQLDAELKQARDDASADREGLRERFNQLRAELLSTRGLLDGLKAYVSQRQDGSAPREAALAAIMSKLEARLDRPDATGKDRATAGLDWTRLAGLAAMIGGAAGLPTWLLVGLRGAPKVAGVVRTIRRKRRGEDGEEIEEETVEKK